MLPSPQSPGRLAPFAMLIAAMVFLQCGASLSKSLFPMVGPDGATTLRLVWASLVLCLAWRPWRHRFAPRERRTLLVYGLAIGGMMLLIYKAFERIPVGIAVAVEFVGPLTVATVQSRRALDFLWIGLAATGIVLLLPIADLGSPLDPIGVAYALGAGFFWGLYIVAGKRAAGSMPGGVVTALGMTIATIVALPFGVINSGVRLFNWQAIQLAGVVSLLSGIIPYSLEMITLKWIPARTFGVLMALEPVVASLTAALIIGERLTGSQMLAMGCIIAASVGSTVTSPTETPAITPEPTADPEPALPT